MIAPGQDVFKTGPGPLCFADGGQGKNPPEGADEQGRFRNAFYVFSFISEEEIAPQKPVFDPGDRAGKTGIVRFQKMQFAQQEQAGINSVAVPGGREGIQFGIERIGNDFFPDPFGVRPPQFFFCFQFQFSGNRRQPVAGCPAHDTGKGVDFFFAVAVPDVDVGLVEAGDGFFASRSRSAKTVAVGRAVKALVEEGLRAGENDRAVKRHSAFPCMHCYRSGRVPCRYTRRGRVRFFRPDRRSGECRKRAGMDGLSNRQ